MRIAEYLGPSKFGDIITCVQSMHVQSMPPRYSAFVFSRHDLPHAKGPFILLYCWVCPLLSLQVHGVSLISQCVAEPIIHDFSVG